MGTVEVVSERDPALSYSVEVNESGQVWWCSCADWNYRRREGGCKHMRQVQADVDFTAEMVGAYIHDSEGER